MDRKKFVFQNKYSIGREKQQFLVCDQDDFYNCQSLQEKASELAEQWNVLPTDIAVIFV